MAALFGKIYATGTIPEQWKIAKIKYCTHFPLINGLTYNITYGMMIVPNKRSNLKKYIKLNHFDGKVSFDRESIISYGHALIVN